MRNALLATLLTLALLPHAGPAQEKRPGEVVTTIEVDILTLDVLAVDRKGKPVYDLKPQELQIKVGGKVQPIEGFDAPQPPEGVEIAAPSSAAPSAPSRPANPNPLHLVLFFDLEDLPTDGVLSAVEAAREWARSPSGSPAVSVVTYLGAAGALVWDEASPSRVESALDGLLEESRSNRTESRALAMGSTSRGPAPRTWDDRRREVAALAQALIDAQAGGASADIAQSVYNDFSDYLKGERERVKDLTRAIGETAGRLSLLQGRRHMVLITQGIERVPGRNDVDFFKRAVQASKSRTPPTLDAEPRMPFDVSDITARYRFDNSQLRELSLLEEQLASSGVVTHFVAPAATFGMPSADQRPIEALRDQMGDAHQLRAGVEPIVQATGGQARAHGAGGLGQLVDVASATYLVAMRMTGVQTGRSYRVQVACTRPGITVTSRSAYQPKPPASQAPLLAEAARQSAAEERRDERRVGPARRGKSLPVTLRWKGKKSAAGGEKRRYGLEVSVPADALRFVPEADAMVASLKIAIQARALDKPGVEESFTEDAFFAYTGEEYRDAAGKPTVKTITIDLVPGRWELAVTVRDELESAFGTATERVTAEE